MFKYQLESVEKKLAKALEKMEEAEADKDEAKLLAGKRKAIAVFYLIEKIAQFLLF